MKQLVLLVIFFLALTGCTLRAPLATELPRTQNNNTNQEQPICVDQCGDGVCQEIVCLGSGCPCVETAESCPQDCQVSPAAPAAY